MPPTAGSIMPKTPPQQVVRRSEGVSLVLALGVFALFVVGIGYGGMYAYTIMLNRSLESAKVTLQQSEKQFEPQLISQLSTLDRQLKIANQLLNQHTQITPVLKMLEETASSSVQYDDFRYEYAKDEKSKPTLRIRGQARSYQAIAQQSTTLGNSKVVAEHIFSDFKVNTNGRVDFVLTLTPAADSIIYANWLKLTNQDSVLLPQPTGNSSAMDQSAFPASNPTVTPPVSDTNTGGQTPAQVTPNNSAPQSPTQ
jgi:hypothetical protein